MNEPLTRKHDTILLMKCYKTKENKGNEEMNFNLKFLLSNKLLLKSRNLVRFYLNSFKYLFQ